MSIHPIIPYFFLVSIASLAFLTGTIVHKHYKIKSLWANVAFVLLWFGIFGLYYWSIKRTYEKLAIELSTEESHKDKVKLLVSFYIAMILKMISIYIYYHPIGKTASKIWAHIITAFLIVILGYQISFINKYHKESGEGWQLWLKAPYATELVFSLIT